MNNTNFRISGCILFAVTLLALSCTKVNRDDDFPAGDVPPIAGGFTASGQVATASLLAHWSFDDTKAEEKSSAVPLKDSNSAYVPGVIGKALQLNKGYLLYPTITALSNANALSSVTVSMWVKTSNNGNYFTEFFTLARDTTKESDWLSILNVGAETGRPNSNPNITWHSWIGSFPAGSRQGGDNINDYGNAGSDFQITPATSNWYHYVMRYDGTGEVIDLYVDNIRVSNNNFRQRTGLGKLVMPTPTQVLIGAFSNSSSHYPMSATLGFHGFMDGAIDDVRVFGKALTDPEISALFQLGKQGR